MAEESRGAIAAAFTANLGIAIAKFAAFAFTGAASMLAEGIHSLADTGNQLLLFVGGKRAHRPPDELHQFGHGGERYFYAFVVALVLFSLGSLFAIVEGIDHYLHPGSVEDPLWAYVVLAISIVLESFSLRTAVKEARPRKRQLSWPSFIRRTKSPELSVLLLEDSGALCGLLFATIGVTAAQITDDARWDALGSVAIGLLLAVIAFVLAVEMKSLLIGESASGPNAEAIRAAIESCPEVRRIIHLRTLHLGPDELLVAAKLDLAADSYEELAREIDQVEAAIRAAVPIATVIYIEPDLYRSVEPPPGR
ncbi:MAG: cation transporter [Actinomycetia bacterium]|nr:cation transporter [Actinomycetes bacterium]